MKLLVDECLSDELTKLAQRRGHAEASHIAWGGKRGWKDWELKAVRIVATVELSGDRQASLSSGGTDEIQDLLIHSCSASTIKVKSRGLSPSGDSGRGLRYAPCR